MPTIKFVVNASDKIESVWALRRRQPFLNDIPVKVDVVHDGTFWERIRTKLHDPPIIEPWVFVGYRRHIELIVAVPNKREGAYPEEIRKKVIADLDLTEISWQAMCVSEDTAKHGNDCCNCPGFTGRACRM